MKKQILKYIILSIFVVVLVGFFILRNIMVESIGDESRTVYIQKTENRFQLIRNGKPFYIKGAAGNSHFKELAEIGGNTIRLYDTINLKRNLDEAAKYCLAVIVGIPIPRYDLKYNYYVNDNNNQALVLKIKRLIQKYKDHPAVMMWCFNEINVPFALCNNSFVDTMKDIIKLIHSEDINHPVCIALGGISRKEYGNVHLLLRDVDLVSINVFGETKKLQYKLKQLSFLFGNKPYFISEYGADGEWESKTTSWNAPIEQTTAKKTEQIETRFKIISEDLDGGCLGSTVFHWGITFERTYSWFSLIIDNSKSETIKQLKYLWGTAKVKPNFIGLEYMLVDGKGAADNIILSPGIKRDAEVIFKSSKNDNLKIKWEIYPEAWLSLTNDTTLGISNPGKSINCIFNSTETKTTFITPSIEGPYRIFAYVYDDHGYFATTNTPFYVLDPK